MLALSGERVIVAGGLIQAVTDQKGLEAVRIR